MALDPPHRPPTAPHSLRRGITTMWLLVMLPVFLILLCLVIESGNLWRARAELENSLEAAALSAVQQWVDDATAAWPAAAGTQNARQSAHDFARSNPVRGEIVLLDLNYNAALSPNQNDSCSGEMVFGSATEILSETIFDAGAAPGCGHEGGPNLAVTVATSQAGWAQVSLLNQSYTNMVVIGTPVYDRLDPPLVVRVRNATSGNTFQYQVVNVNSGAAVSGVSVHFMVVEAGQYTSAADGVTMEAVKVVSTTTDHNSSWTGQLRSYLNSYAQPVVLGQVMTANDPDWSVFWARDDSSRRNPPDAPGRFRVGLHVAEDPDDMRDPETIGYVVVQAGVGMMGRRRFVAALSPLSIGGVGNGAPFTESFADIGAPAAALASSATMVGGNGGWPILYGNDPLRSDGTTIDLDLAIDEDQLQDAERNHTREHVGHIVFAGTYAVRIRKTLDVPSLCPSLFGCALGNSSVSAEVIAIFDCDLGLPKLIRGGRFYCP